MSARLILDAEVHVFPPDWCRAGFRPPEAEEVLRRVVYDHPQRDKALAGASEQGLLAEMERAGFSGAVVMGLPWASAELTHENNRYAADLQRRYPEKFMALGVLPDPKQEDPLDAVRRLAQELGVCGIKVIPSWHGYRLDDPCLWPALEEMQRLGLVLMPHTDHLFMDPGQGDPAYGLFETARRFPELKIMAPHLGGLLCCYALHEPLRPMFDNILFLGSVSATMKMVEFAVASVGSAKVAFATDFPFNRTNSMADVVESARGLDLSGEVLEAFLGGNLKRFLGRPLG